MVVLCACDDAVDVMFQCVVMTNGYTCWCVMACRGSMRPLVLMYWVLVTIWKRVLWHEMNTGASVIVRLYGSRSCGTERVACEVGVTALSGRSRPSVVMYRREQ